MKVRIDNYIDVIFIVAELEEIESTLMSEGNLSPEWNLKFLKVSKKDLEDSVNKEALVAFLFSYWKTLFPFLEEASIRVIKSYPVKE